MIISSARHTSCVRHGVLAELNNVVINIKDNTKLWLLTINFVHRNNHEISVVCAVHKSIWDSRIH